jgi:superfamily II DNA helicase RecQ
MLRDLCPTVPIIALTATADADTVRDIRQTLALRPQSPAFRAPCDRHNICYVVQVKPDTLEDCAEAVVGIARSHHGHSGIVYAFSRKECQTLADALKQRHVLCAAYHAALTSKEKEKVRFCLDRRNMLLI